MSLLLPGLAKEGKNGQMGEMCECTAFWEERAVNATHTMTTPNWMNLDLDTNRTAAI